ncbi:MAG: extracellular solute-binding protein [Oscillospiraceae bacterium]|nr:extracellular solute-binding protein [Oscillospiraceae bacterium]
MMKLKRLSALLLSAVMVLSLLAGCGGSNDNDGGVDADGIVTLTLFDKNSGSKTFTDQVAEKIMADTGVRLSVENPSGDPGEKLNLMLAGGNYPDIVLMGQGEIVNRYIEAGALVELDDYIAQYPNIQEMYGETLKKTRADDGHNYWLANWYGVDPDASVGVLMRRDFLAEIVGEDRAKSTEPFTQSEYLDILRQFKQLHPEVDGKTSIALSVVSSEDGGYGSLKGMFGLKTYYKAPDGTLQHWTKDPQYMQAMLFMNDIAAGGLLDKEWIVNKDEQWKQKLSGGYVFSTFGAYWDTSDVNTSLSAAYGEDAQFYMYKVVADNLSANQTTYNGRSTLGWDAIGITKNCKNVDAAMKLVNYLVSEEGQYLLMWGIEGEHWTIENGVHVPKAEILDGLLNDFDATSNETGIRKWTWFVKNGFGSDGTPYDLTTKYQMDDTSTFANEVIGESDAWDTAEFSGLEPAGSTPLGLQWQKVADVMNQNYSKIVEAADHNAATAAYEAMLAEMEASGLAACEEYITEQYQARMALWNS